MAFKISNITKDLIYMSCLDLMFACFNRQVRREEAEYVKLIIILRLLTHSQDDTIYIKKL